MTKGGSSLASDATIDQKVAFLSAMPGVEEVIETHMAHVFLTATDAFKIKKPVSFGYFNHKTLAARAIACAEELRLNRALAGDVYIGLVPLVQCDGQLALTEAGFVEGQVVDWLVHMRRLPADRMLDALIVAGSKPSSDEVAAVMALLARFYRRQQKTPPPPGLYFAHLQREQAVNVTNLNEMALHVPFIAIPQIVADMTGRLVASKAEVVTREAAGLIVEGHGDLRPEHVCLTDPPVIFDRVESALELRVIDVFDEVGYLASECTMLGRAELGSALTGALKDAGFAPPSARLRTAYTMFRLITRARLALDHLRDKTPRTPAKWPARARDYLTEAQRLSGLVGSRITE